MIAIRGSISHQKMLELVSTLHSMLPAKLAKRVVVIRLHAIQACNAVTIRVSADIDSASATRVEEAVKSMGIRVLPYTRSKVGKEALVFCFTSEDDFKVCTRALARTKVLLKVASIPCTVTDLSGSPRSYVEAYCDFDGALSGIQTVLEGKIDLALYKKKGTVYFPRKTQRRAAKPKAKPKP